MTASAPKVAFVERILTHYRVKIYEEIRLRLARDGIRFVLIYGQPDPEEAKKNDTTRMEHGVAIRNRYLPGRLVWQPCWAELRDCDLIIVEQANRFLLNYFLMAIRPFRRFRLAFNGHGYNHQAKADGILNRVKRLYSNQVDWWFPYTEKVAEYLAQGGFPRERMSVMNNSIDTRALKETADSIPAAEVSAFQVRLGIGEGPVGIYCGGMYAEKEIPFLIQACRGIRSRLPGFRMIFLGDGSDAHLVREAAGAESWIHYPGPKFGREKALYLRSADVFLMPGLVGLAILDAFTLGLPMLTTRYPYHSPEIAYLSEGENGMISEFTVDDYVRMVVRTVSDKALLERLKRGCRESSRHYSAERMIESIADGIKTWLKTP